MYYEEYEDRCHQYNQAIVDGIKVSVPWEVIESLRKAFTEGEQLYNHFLKELDKVMPRL